jgi:5-methylcytosine-specific restriction endonuclease McrA
MTPNTSKRAMPSEKAIRAHWVDRLWRVKGFDSMAEFLEPGTCFACGMDGSERVHIVARSAGGCDKPENLHILCRQCHKDSEYLDGEKYMEWMLERTPFDRFTSSAIRAGFNPSTIFSIVRAARLTTPTKGD